MTEPIPNPTESIKIKSNADKFTIFKSAYWWGKKVCHLFINYGYDGHNSFSIVIKQGNYSNIHNLTADESVPIVKNMFSKLSPEQRKEVLNDL